MATALADPPVTPPSPDPAVPDASPSVYTPEDVAAMSNGPHLYELVDGQLLEGHKSLVGGRVVMQAAHLVLGHLDEHPIADVVDPETSFRCFPHEPDMLRRADLAVLLVERLDDSMLTGILTIAPDLVVEVVSPGDVMSEVLNKVDDWRRAGVREVWVIDPVTRRALAFGEAGDRVVNEDEPLVAEHVLPGFARPLRDFLRVRGPTA